MARTRWPPGPVKPRPLAQARQIRPAAPVGALKLGPGRQIVSQDNSNGRQPNSRSDRTRSPTLCPHQVKPAEAGPEALSTSSLPNTSGVATVWAVRVSAHRLSSSAHAGSLAGKNGTQDNRCGGCRVSSVAGLRPAGRHAVGAVRLFSGGGGNLLRLFGTGSAGLAAAGLLS